MHVYYNNLISGENSYSKLSLIDLAGSEGQILEDDSGERVTDLLHVMKSLSAYVMLTIIFSCVAISFLLAYQAWKAACFEITSHCTTTSSLEKLMERDNTLNAFTLIIADSFTLKRME